MLWKALQEQIVKTEYLEARLFEVENLFSIQNANQRVRQKQNQKIKSK